MPTFGREVMDPASFTEFAGTRRDSDSAIVTAVIEILNDVAAVELDAAAVMQMIVDRCRVLTGADGAVIEFIDGPHLVARVTSGAANVHHGVRLTVDDSLSGLCYRTRHVLTCEDTETDPRVAGDVRQIIGVRSMAVVPLPGKGENGAGGVLKVFSAVPNAFGPTHVQGLRLMAGVFAAAARRAGECEDKRHVLARHTATLTALRESEQRFRNAFSHASIGMALIGLDGRWLQVNPSICRIVGYTEPELLNLTFQDITHPDDLEADLAYVGQLVRGEIDHYHFPKRYFHKDGHVVWILLSVSMVRDAAGQPLHFVSQIQDITDRKRVETFESDQRRVLESIAAGRPLAEALDLLTLAVDHQIHGGATSVLLLDAGGLKQFGPGIPGPLRQAIDAGSYRFAQGLCAHGVGRDAGGLVARDVSTDPACAPVRTASLDAGYRRCWSVPVRASDGSFLAVINTFTRHDREPDEREAGVMWAVRELTLVAIEHRQRLNDLDYRARHDPLTGLANRVVAEDRLAQAMSRARRHGNKAALVLLDLDRFKEINDTLGHEAGDALLQEVARRLSGCLREADTAARVGGDEFAVVLPEIRTRADVDAFAHRVVAALNVPFDLAGQSHKVTGSIGVSLFPDDGPDAATLRARADAALYRVKAQGRNGFMAASDA